MQSSPLSYALLGISVLFNSMSSIAQEVQKNSGQISSDYKRSSLYTLMITNSSREYEKDIKDYFTDKLLPEKYNNHNLESRYIETSNQKNEIEGVKKYLSDNRIANQIVAKWFNRSPKGGFDMQLIKERGYYDASILDITKAKNSVKGIAALADAGEELIGNTFVLVNDSKYTNKEVVANKAKSLLSAFGSQLGLSDLTTQITDLTLTTFGKGFVVATHSYLFKLVWNDEIQSQFYTQCYAEDSDITPEKRAAFDNATFFKLEYVGTDKSMSDVQSTSLTTKSNSELIGRATVKSIDNVISKLQNEYDVFKTKTPMYSTSPITAKIGLKDGVTSKTKFEVLEQQQDDKGKIKYVRVGTLKVDNAYPIWDNRYGADEDNPNQKTNKTYFKATSGRDFSNGLLVRQIK